LRSRVFLACQIIHKFRFEWRKRVARQKRVARGSPRFTATPLPFGKTLMGQGRTADLLSMPQFVPERLPTIPALELCASRRSYSPNRMRAVRAGSAAESNRARPPASPSYAGVHKSLWLESARRHNVATDEYLIRRSQLEFDRRSVHDCLTLFPHSAECCFPSETLAVLVARNIARLGYWPGLTPALESAYEMRRKSSRSQRRGGLQACCCGTIPTRASQRSNARR
jgi:hypothetical protein